MATIVLYQIMWFDAFRNLGFLDKYNPDQFEIIGQTHSGDISVEVELLRKDPEHKHRGIVHGESKEKYARILIKNKKSHK